MESSRIYGGGWLASFVALDAVAFFIVGTMTDFYIAASISLGALASVVYFGLQEVPADPPHRAILKRFGRRIDVVVGEGWVFLFPVVYSLVLVSFEVWTLKLDNQLVRTPGMGEVSVPVTIIGQVDVGDGITEEERGRAIIAYENSGGKDGVQDVVTAKVGPALREWGISLPDVTDPATGETRSGSWEDAIAAGPDASRCLASGICGRSLSEDELGDFFAANGFLQMTVYGTRILDVEIGEIEPTGKLADSAEQAAKELRDQEAEVIELEHVGKRARKLMDDLGMTYGDAIELIQTERKKVVKTIDEKKFNVSPEAKAAIEGTLTAGLGLLAAKLGAPTGPDEEGE